jgi:hypothetical protein
MGLPPKKKLNMGTENPDLPEVTALSPATTQFGVFCKFLLL